MNNNQKKTCLGIDCPERTGGECTAGEPIMETITIRRVEAPFNIEIVMHIPDDGFNMFDVKSIEMDGHKIEPVESDLAVPILGSLAALLNILGDAVDVIKSDKPDASTNNDLNKGAKS